AVGRAFANLSSPRLIPPAAGRHGRRPPMTINQSTDSSRSSERRSDEPQLRVHIRWMIRRDMAEVVDVERASFEFPWFEEEFIRCLRQRNCIGMVAEHAERVVG